MRIILKFLLILLAVGSTMLSQNVIVKDHAIGGSLGFDSYSVSSDFLWREAPNCCDKFQDGSGMGFGISAYYLYYLNRNFNHLELLQPSIAIQLGFRQYSTQHSKNEFTKVLVNQQVADGSFEHFLQNDISSIDLSAMYQYPILKDFNIAVGPQIGYLINTSFNQKESIVKPENVGVFPETQTRIRNNITGDISSFEALQFGVRLSLNYALPLNKENNLHLVPNIDYYQSINDIYSNNNDYISHSFFRFGIGIQGTTFAEKETEYIKNYRRDTIKIMSDKDLLTEGDFKLDSEDRVTGDFVIQNYLAIDTLYYAIKATNTKPEDRPISKLNFVEGKEVSELSLRVEITREIYPILPYVFFEDASYNLPTRYNRLTNPRGFSMNDLNPSPTLYHRNILNIIGSRMIENKQTKIELFGYIDPSTEAGNCDLALSRATTIKDYLVDIFNIEESRIKVITTNEQNCVPVNLTRTPSPQGYAENRRVEIKSNTPELLFATTNTVYQNPLTVSPEQLEFEIECYNEANLKNVDSWKLTANQGNYTIAEFTGKDKQKLIDVKIDKNNARLLTGGKDLEISLSSYVKDKSNEEKLNVKVKKDTNNIEIETLTLTLFQVSQTTLNPKLKQEISEFLKNIQSGSEIRITGYTDNLGQREQNKALSQVRAEEVRKFIQTLGTKAKITTVVGVGADEFAPGVNSHDTPEERFISRTVAIEIKRFVGR